MLGFLKRVFAAGRRQERPEASAVMADQDLERIERELRRIGTGYEAARLLNRAGDLYLVKKDRGQALNRYGAAIDAYLQAGEYDNAMAVCRKIIRMVPEVIRTRRTLAWLCLGKGFLEMAREHIAVYVAASKEAGLQALAVQQLQLMAQYVDRADFRELLAERLEGLGDENAAKRVRVGEAIDSVRAAGWATVVFAAMLTPEELRQAADEGVDIVAPTAAERYDDLDRYFIEPDQGTDPASAALYNDQETVGFEHHMVKSVIAPDHATEEERALIAEAEATEEARQADSVTTEAGASEDLEEPVSVAESADSSGVAEVEAESEREAGDFEASAGPAEVDETKEKAKKSKKTKKKSRPKRKKKG